MKVITRSLMVLVLVLMSGCELMGPQMSAPLQVYPEAEVPQIDHNTDKFAHLQNQQENEVMAMPEVEIYRGTGNSLINNKTIGGRDSRQQEGKYTLNFDQADLGEVAKVILSDTLGLNYVLDPKVSGTVTIQTTHPLTEDELLPTLEMLLAMNNAALVTEGGIYSILPIGDSLKTSALNIGTNRTGMKNGYRVQVMPLQYVGVLDMMEILKPLVAEKSILRSDEARNLLFVAGTANELRHVRSIINTFDVDTMKGMSFGLFPLAHVDPVLIIEELESILDSKEGTPLAGMIRFLPIERMNSVMVITPQARYLDNVHNWIERLDRANLSANGGVLVYRVQNVDAEELAETLNEIFSDNGQEQQRVSLAPGARSAQISNSNNLNNSSNSRNNSSNSRSNTDRTRNQSSTAATNTNNSSPTGAGNSVNISDLTDINIIADKINNALIIVATPQQFGPIMTVIKQLDVMPLQVLIDVMIIEVTLTDDLEYGIEWAIKTGSFRNTLQETATDGIFSAARTGFTTLYTGMDIQAVLNALAEKQKINVISAPSLMVLNNNEASINVGDQIPVATSSSTNTNGGENAFVTNNIERIDTGITLVVTPRVNAGGLVVMEIEQEANQVVDGTAGSNNTPTISQREISSTIAVQSGETVVLGGLIQETQSNIQSGVPFLHSLPLIGPLFGTTDRSVRKTELVMVITPRVLTNAQDAREITNEFKRKLTGLYEVIEEETMLESEAM